MLASRADLGSDLGLYLFLTFMKKSVLCFTDYILFKIPGNVCSESSTQVR